MKTGVKIGEVPIQEMAGLTPMVNIQSKVSMSMEEYRLLRDLVYNYCGIFFQEDVKYLMERRINSRLRELVIGNYTEYYRYLRYSPNRRQELEEIIELLTTNETYFFREEYQLTAFRDEILPELIRNNADQKRLRIWSAGSSTGEEAYTVAILAHENPELRDWDVEIFANDISRKVVQKARKGLYGKSSFRSTKNEYIQKYFRRQENLFLIDERIRSMVSFGHLNLLDDEMLQLIGEVDLIFCRNVLIYFDKQARLRVLKMFYDKLRPHGYLLLGHSESLMNVSMDFELVHLKNDMVYRKPVM